MRSDPVLLPCQSGPWPLHCSTLKEASPGLGLAPVQLLRLPPNTNRKQQPPSIPSLSFSPLKSQDPGSLNFWWERRGWGLARAPEAQEGIFPLVSFKGHFANQKQT